MLLRMLLMLACIFPCISIWANPAIEAMIPNNIPMGRDADVLMQVKDGINSQFVIMPGGPFIKQTLPLPYRLYDLAVYEGFGLVAAGERGLLVVDVAGPAKSANPKIVGSYAVENKITRVVVENDQAWVVENETEITVLSLANLAKPVALGRYQVSQPIADMVVRGGYVYLLLACSQTSVTSTDEPMSQTQHMRDRPSGNANTLVCDKGTDLVIIDMRLPHAPLKLSHTTLARETKKIFVKGNYIYAAQPASGLAIINATDKTRPIQISHHAVTGGATAITVQDNIALLARGVNGIAVFDVADPLHIKWLGSHSRLGRVTGITVGSSLHSPRQALLWNDRNEVITLDITRPALPSIVASRPDIAPVAALWLDAMVDTTINNGAVIVATSSAIKIVDFSGISPLLSNENLDTGQGVNFGGQRRLFIDGDIAYVTDWFSGLHLYDIRTPSHPRLLSSFHTPGSAKGVVVRDGYAFVADDDHGLQVLDVRDPAHPTFIANLATNGLAYTPKLAGNLLYLASHRGGFQIIDVSNPASPKIISDVDTPGKSWSLEVAGNTLFVADDTSGILVFDVTDPALPKQIGVFNPTLPQQGAAEDVVVRGDTAYAAFFDQGFYVLDITNPATPQQIGHTPTPGNARAIELKDNFAYVTDWFAGVQVIDISNKTAPSIVGEYDTSGAAWGIGIKGDYAYIGDWWGGFAVLDISNPKVPTLADHYHARGPILQIAAQGKFSYAAIEQGGIQVFDITNPLNPTWVTGVDVDGAIQGLLIDGTLIYIAVGSGKDSGLVVVDISNPFQARRINHISIEGGAQRLRIGAGRLYFINAKGLGVIDLGNPAQPTLLPSYAAKINDVWIDDKRIYLATDQGMEVLDMQLNVKSRYKIVREATLVRARGNAVFLYVAGLGLRVLDVTGATIRPLSFFDPGEMLSDIILNEGVLYAAGAALAHPCAHRTWASCPAQDAHLLAIDITDLKRLKIQSLYPLARPAMGITITNNTALLAGNDIITSVKLLPSVVITHRDKKDIRLTLPKQLPAGTYHAVSIAPNGKRSMSYNMLNIEAPRSTKPKITPEEFQRLLQEQRKGLLEREPVR